MSWTLETSKIFAATISFLVIACHGAITAPFALNSEGDSESDFQTDSESEDGNTDTTDVIMDTFSQDGTESNSDSDRLDNTDPQQQTDLLSSDTSEPNSDSIETESYQEDTETINASDSEPESSEVSASDSIPDADTESVTDTDESESDEETPDCPGSCQYNRISSEELKASGLTAGFYIDPSVSSYLLCDNGTTGLGYETFPVYSGWIRDNSFHCSGIGRYCCRPQTAYDRYCSDFGGLCEPSGHPGEGPGFCAFASNECVLGDTP